MNYKKINMKELLLKIAGVKTEEAFYKKFPDQKSFFKAHPEAKEIIAQYQQQEMMANAPENSEEQIMGTEEEMVEQMAMGGMIKRKDGSYSRPGLWDAIRANKGSGKKPTKQMLEAAKKIQAEEMMYGGMVDNYYNGGGINNPGFKALPKSVQNNIIANMAMGGMVDSYYNGGGINNEGFKALPKSVQENIISNMSMGGEVEEYKNGGYTVRRSNDRKGKTHVVTGPDGTKKYFGDPKLGERSKSKYGKEGFYARHAKNLKNNPFFRAYARSTWADGGILPDVQQLMMAGQDVYEMGGMVEYPTYYPGGGMIGSDMIDYQADYNYPTMYPDGGSVDKVEKLLKSAKDVWMDQPVKAFNNSQFKKDLNRLPEKTREFIKTYTNPELRELYNNYQMGNNEVRGLTKEEIENNKKYELELLARMARGVDNFQYPMKYGKIGNENNLVNSRFINGGMIAGPMMGYEEDDFMYAMGGGININPANEGKFTEWAQKRGMTVQEAANKVMANRSKYTADVVKMANFAKNAAGWKKAMGGRIYQEGGMLNSMTEGIPVQTETFEGQAEQVALPDGTIKSVEATTAHENMGDDTVTDVLPGGSHIQSARNKLTPDQYIQLMQMFKPETADQDIKKLSQVYKNKYGTKNGKKLSPADISEYAKNKYQNKSTPNSFDTDKLKEGNKKAYLDLSMQMNDLIKSGKELAEGAMLEEQMMAYGGMVNKYVNGTPKKGVQKPTERKIISLTDKAKELEIFNNVLNKNPYGVVDYTFQKTQDASKNLFGIDYNTFNDRMKQYENIIPGLASKYFKKDDKGNYLPPSKENTVAFQRDFDAYVDNMTSKLKGTYSDEQINTLKSNLKFNDAIDPSAKRYDSKMGQFTSSRSGFQFPLFSKETTDKLNKAGVTFLSQAVGKGLLSPEEEQVAREEMNKYQDYKLLPTPEQTAAVVEETPAKKAEKQMLSEDTPIAPAARIPMQNRFNFGLLEGQLGRGLGANQAAFEAGLSLDPLYIMETPDTYIRSRKNEIPVGNILYNIEKAQRNTANALADQTGDWSTLAGNIANAGAQAYNQLGDTLSKLNQTNVALYNQTQGLEQDLLASNMGVRNQNLTNAQNMANFKRNLFGQKAVQDSEIYSEYSKSMSENAQKEQNQKLEMLNIMAAKPDMFKGEQGQMFVNQILGNTGTYNNPYAGTLLDNILSFNRYKR